MQRRHFTNVLSFPHRLTQGEIDICLQRYAGPYVCEGAHLRLLALQSWRRYNER